MDPMNSAPINQLSGRQISGRISAETLRWKVAALSFELLKMGIQSFFRTLGRATTAQVA